MTAVTFEAFIAPWRETFPALALAELYASPNEAERLLARAVLVMEWCDALWRASDERVTSAKLGWWAEEWERIRVEQGRHPISAHLQPAKVAAPLLHLLRDGEGNGSSTWQERCEAYAAIGAELASAFAYTGIDHGGAASAAAQCWTVLVASRHLAAVWSGQSAALRGLPLDARARHQIRLEAPALASLQHAANEGARHSAMVLGTLFSSTPVFAWQQQRGARVLTAIAVRELQHLGHPASRLDAWRNGFAAWRTARQGG